MIDIHDLIGLSGISLSIYSYARVQWQRDYAKKLIYSVLNLAAAILVGSSLLYKWNPASFVGNLFWGLISLYGIYRCLKYKFRQNAA